MSNKDFINFDIHSFSKENKKKYLYNDPFPHLVIDDFFNEEILSSILKEFPDLSKSNNTIKNSHPAEVKLSSDRGDSLQGKNSKNLLRYLNSSVFLDFLQELTSIKEKLIPDPHFIGGGLHELKKGGFLKVHADYCFHSETNLDRRINLLIYLNKNWKKEYKGDLELWDKEMKNCKKKISPIFNRVVIFNTTDIAYHGNPSIVSCPKNDSRKSIALYYFSNGRPKNEERSILIQQSTLFKQRPGERFKFNLRFILINLTREILPPIIFRIFKKIYHSRK